MDQFKRVVQPVLAVQRHDQCSFAQRAHSTMVMLPVSAGYGMQIAQALVVRHHEGDVSILEVVTPEGMKLLGAEVELRNNLRRGEHYERVAIYKMWSGVAFQRWGFKDLNERVGSVTHYFPDIRRASPVALQKLSKFTGLEFRVNLQVVWKEYRKIEDTRFELHNYAARQLSEFNAQCMERMNQSISEFADVAWGTEVEVARQLMAVQIASEGDPKFDKSSPMLGQGKDVDVVCVSPAEIDAREQVAIETVAPAQIEVEEVVHA